jgi:hypothetical protein
MGLKSLKEPLVQPFGSALAGLAVWWFTHHP